MSAIKLGQVYASTHSGDMEQGIRQRRRVTAIELNHDVGGPQRDSYVWLQTEDTAVRVARVRLRGPSARTIPGHRLVEDGA